MISGVTHSRQKKFAFNVHQSLTGINARRMDVWVEGALYWDELNVNAVAGYSSALVFQVPSPIVVTDGRLTIQLTPSVNNPFISAIEVLLASSIPPAPVPIKTPTKAPTKLPTKAPTKLPTKAPTKLPTKAPTIVPTKLPTKLPTKAPTKVPTKAPTKTPTKAPTNVPVKAPVTPIPAPVNIQPPANTVVHRINCGSTTAVTDANGTLWSKDVNFVNGYRLLTCPANVTNNIYCSSRYFRNASTTPARYNLPVPANGTYLLRLHFAEQYVNAINQRKFDVTVEDLLVIDDLDIFAIAPGRDVPRIISFGTTVLDGSITIQFLPGINNPQINGIEVISLGPPVAPPTNAPVTAVPTATPVSVPIAAPTSNVTFQDILINSGGTCQFLLKY
jgi:Malectin domain